MKNKPYSVEKGKKFINWYAVISRLRSIVKNYSTIVTVAGDNTLAASSEKYIRDSYSAYVKDLGRNVKHRQIPIREVKFIIRAAKDAADWVTCACGNTCAIISRSSSGEPNDGPLSELGVEFSIAISALDLKTASKTLSKIERRASEIIQEIVESESAEVRGDIRIANEEIKELEERIAELQKEAKAIKDEFESNYQTKLLITPPKKKKSKK